MKTRSFLGLIAIGSLAVASCTTETTTTRQTQTDQTTTRVHTQAELRKTGESQTGPALEKTDAAIRTEGNRRFAASRRTREHSRYPVKALRYFFCVVLPPVAVLMTGRILSFILSLLLTLLGWVPGVIHACLVVNDYQAEHRR